ncbi:MAG: alpha/beta fold hydrolase [Candidatus Binatia bacterium]
MTKKKFELALERLHLKEKRRRPPVILSHGFLLNSRFMDLDEEHSLAAYLAKEGFDVWNLSLRGTGRSLNPLKGGPKNWSLDDIINDDLSEVIRYVQKESGNSRVGWVGFELGGLLSYGYLEKKRPRGISALVTLGAPATFSRSEQKPLKHLLRLEENPTFKRVFLYLDGPFLGRLLIPLVPKIRKLFYNPENMDEGVRTEVLETALAPINPGVLDHLLMMIRRGEFVSADGKFSYRRNLSRVHVPVLLIGGKQDSLAPPGALRSTYRALGSKDRMLRIFGSQRKGSADYGHLDLILGKNSKQEVYPVIGRWLKRRVGRR